MVDVDVGIFIFIFIIIVFIIIILVIIVIVNFYGNFGADRMQQYDKAFWRSEKRNIDLEKQKNNIIK